MAIEENSITIFFSWQSDSSHKTNLNFIEDCLRKAVKEIAKEKSTVIVVDRDTKGIGGTPGIVEAILKKIRICDVFVWDATLIQGTPRYTPNPNVLLELGYALAIVGEGRIIGIMNEGNGSGPDKLPFDLAHRRWPIRYKLDESDPRFEEVKNKTKNSVIQVLKEALRAALNEPRAGAIQSDTDFLSARVLWGVINSDWIRNWTYFKRSQIQYDKREYRDIMHDYCDMAAKPENQFLDEKLNLLHEELVKAMRSYLWTAAIEMVPCYGNDDVFVIEVKDRAQREDNIENYDEIYDKEASALEKGIDAVESAWNAYVYELRSRYPEITHELQI